MKKIKYINWSTKIFEGFYESNLYNSDTLYNITTDDDEIGENECWDFTETGYTDFEKAVSEACVNLLFENLDQGDDKLIKSMKFVALHSPSYYNFETDKLEIEIECDWDGLVKYAQTDHRQEFDDYLRENFTSYDGFTSFVPNNVGEFFVYLSDDFERLSQVIIEFYILSKLDYDRYWSDYVEAAHCEIWNHIEKRVND